jgi:hypothetical protein
VKSLEITLGGITTSIAVVSVAPPRWARAGGEPRKPGEVIHELFTEARAEGIAETSIMAPRVKVYDGETPLELAEERAVLAWLILCR